MGAFEFILGAGFVAIPLLVGAGFAMSAPPFEDFRRARICLWASAAIAIILLAMWGAQSTLAFWARASLACVVACAVTLALMGGLRWIREREDKAGAVQTAVSSSHPADVPLLSATAEPKGARGDFYLVVAPVPGDKTPPWEIAVSVPGATVAKYKLELPELEQGELVFTPEVGGAQLHTRMGVDAPLRLWLRPQSPARFLQSPPAARLTLISPDGRRLNREVPIRILNADVATATPDPRPTHDAKVASKMQVTDFNIDADAQGSPRLVIVMKNSGAIAGDAPNYTVNVLPWPDYFTAEQAEEFMKQVVAEALARPLPKRGLVEVDPGDSVSTSLEMILDKTAWTEVKAGNAKLHVGVVLKYADASTPPGAFWITEVCVGFGQDMRGMRACANRTYLHRP
ncbi:hypothetical protein [Phenylobacterium sp.]|uniref:hypothetical protein n=1 Tax=Phenylobacterium sp. TaxID=1871053 RepID=UPI002C26BEE6|nr:hypothetical protein [Phenylobacterium sp.]HVI32666.1 hypothetical protein [Phenylobacterium sp.]